MATERGRITITGFDTDAVRERDDLTDWDEDTDSGTKSRWRRAFTRFRHNRVAMLGLAVVAIMAVVTLLARPITVFGIPIQPISLAPYDPETILRLQPGIDTLPTEPPSLQHPFGTDKSGRDLFSRVLAGGRYSVSIGFVVVFLTATVGLVYGAIAGYYGGWVDEIMMRVLDVIFAFPGLLLALVLVAMFGGGYWQLVAAFSIFGWAFYARLIRGEILKVKENEYVMAARALGARDRSVIFRHVVPNSVAPLIVQASLSIGTVVIGVAALGFLGLGFDPGTPEWGTILSQSRETLVPGPGQPIAWWITVFPGMAIFTFVMAMNMIGDGINDALDAQEVSNVGGQGGG